MSYGRPATYKKITDISVDYKTGEQAESETTYNLSKVIRLPRKTSSFTRLLGQLGIFNRGGETDKTYTEFILDARILPSGFVPEVRNDYLLVNDKRYNVEEIEELDGQLGYFLMTEAHEGAEQ